MVEIPALDGAMWGERGFFVAEALFVVGAYVVVGALRALEGSVVVGGAFVEKRPPLMGDTGENFFVERFILDGGLLDILGLRVAFGKETKIHRFIIEKFGFRILDRPNVRSLGYF